jgi:hypothetical protein
MAFWYPALAAGWGASPHVRHETTPVHHAARRRGGGVDGAPLFAVADTQKKLKYARAAPDRSFAALEPAASCGWVIWWSLYSNKPPLFQVIEKPESFQIPGGVQ